MSVQFTTETFNRVGKRSGEKKIVKDTNGNDTVVYVDEQGNPIDNTYQAKQIVEGSLSDSDGPSFLSDALEVCEGDISRVRDYFTSGANMHLRLEAGGYTPEEKAAKALIKSGLPAFAGKTVEEVVLILNSLKK